MTEKSWISNEEVTFIEDRFQYWVKRRLDAQNRCLHVRYSKKPFTIEGYAEKTIYRNDCKCELCGKFWVEDQ